MNKLYYYVLLIIFTINSISFPVYGQEVKEQTIRPATEIVKIGSNQNTIVAYADPYSTANMSVSYNMGTPIIAERDGRKVWKLELDGSKDQYNGIGRYLYFDLDDSLIYQIDDGSTFDIEIEYWSSSGGFFEFAYDSTITTVARGRNVNVGSDEMFKVEKISIDDAFFGNNLTGEWYKNSNINCDFHLSNRTRMVWDDDIHYNYTCSLADVYIASVKVVRHVAAKPILVNSKIDEVGNTFESYLEEKIISNKLTNSTDETFEAKVTFRGIEKYGKFVEATENITFSPHQVIDYDFNVKTDYCGIYQYEVIIQSLDGTIDIVHTPLRFAIVKTDPNHIVNYDHIYNWHYARVKPEIQNDYITMLSKANSSGSRLSVYWSDCEKIKGVYENVALDNVMQQYRKRGMKAAVLLNPVNALYGDAMSSLTSISKIVEYTPEQKSGIENWLSWMVKEYGDVIQVFEVRNEVVQASQGYFNDPIATGLNHTLLCKLISEHLDKIAPEIEISGFASCRTGDTDVLQFYQSCLDNGLANYVDSIVWHWYEHFNTYERGYHRQLISKYEEQWKKYTEKPLKIYNSEAGNTCSTTSYATVADEDVKGKYAVRSYLIFQSSVGGLYATYNLERTGPRPWEREDRFGHIASGIKYEISTENDPVTMMPSDAYLYTAAMNYWFANSSKYKLQELRDNNLYICSAKSDKFDSSVAAIWTNQYDEQLSVNLGCKSVTYSDFFGNEETLYSDNGVYTFVASDRPMYLQGDFSKIEVLDKTIFTYMNTELETAQNDKFIIKVKCNEDIKNLKLDCELPGVMSIDSVSDFDEFGEATVQINLGDEYEGSNILRIKILKNENVIHVADLKVKVGIGINSSLSVTSAEKGNYNRWKLSIDIKNNYLTRALKGKINIKKSDLTADINDFDIGIIPKGKTSRVFIPLPQIYKREKCNLEYDIVLDNGDSYSYNQLIDFTFAPKRKTDIVVDGIIGENEWILDTALISDSIDNIQKIADWGGIKDLSAKTMLQWDEEKLYLFSRVIDDVYSQPEPAERMWAGDSVQIGLYKIENVSVAEGQGGTDFAEIALGIDCETKKPVAYMHKDQYNAANRIGIMKDYELYVNRNEALSYTDYEFAIRWDELFGRECDYKLNDIIAFAAIYNDNDGDGRRGWMEYASGIGNTKSVELFSQLRLIE